MKQAIALAVLLTASFWTTASAEEAWSVADLGWLAGCWESVGGEVGSGEQWTFPAGGTLFGVSRTIHDSKTIGYEFLQIRETDDGGIEFVAQPSGQAAAAFAMVRMSADEVVFENPDHDFPQRIIYSVAADETLEARIEGMVEGENRTVEFPMKRIDCTPDTKEK